MRKSHLLAVLAASVLTIAAVGLHAAAQGPPRTAMRPPAAPGGPGIALLDVSRVFKDYIHFQQMRDAMTADMERAEAQVRAERDKLRNLREELKKYPPGSPDYKSLEEQIITGDTNLAARVRLQRRDFLQREAKIYHIVYQEICQEVDYYARNHGIAMVLRFSGDPVDPEKPETVLRHINKPVIWFNGQLNIDITPNIVHELNRRRSPGTAPGPIGTRHGVGPNYR